MATVLPWGPIARFLNVVYQGFGDRHDLYKIPSPPGHWLLGERGLGCGAAQCGRGAQRNCAGDGPAFMHCPPATIA